MRGCRWTKGGVSLSKVAAAQRLSGHQSRVVVDDHAALTLLLPLCSLLLKCLYFHPEGLITFVLPMLPQLSLGEGLSKWPDKLLVGVQSTFSG